MKVFRPAGRPVSRVGNGVEFALEDIFCSNVELWRIAKAVELVKRFFFVHRQNLDEKGDDLLLISSYLRLLNPRICWGGRGGKMIDVFADMVNMCSFWWCKIHVGVSPSARQGDRACMGRCPHWTEVALRCACPRARTIRDANRQDCLRSVESLIREFFFVRIRQGKLKFSHVQKFYKVENIAVITYKKPPHFFMLRFNPHALFRVGYASMRINSRPFWKKKKTYTERCGRSYNMGLIDCVRKRLFVGCGRSGEMGFKSWRHV